MQGDRGNMDALILINTSNAGRQGKYGLTLLLMLGDRGNMDSLTLINTTNAGRQGKYGLTHIN